jgi:hypothetical protein
VSADLSEHRLPLALTTYAPTQNPLKTMTLEQLGNIEVTTVSKEPEEVWNTPAAIYVITQEDIQRSGATNIPEALRLAPGVEVARITSGEYAIGIRGFNSRLSRSVLVLIDGRTVYTTFTAGTYWETQDVLMKDIDRIEVIRGPGGTIWGPNAVNGVINIITRNKRIRRACWRRGGGNVEAGSRRRPLRLRQRQGDSPTASMRKDLDGRPSTTPMATTTTTGIVVRVVSAWTGMRAVAIAFGCRAMYTARALAREHCHNLQPARQHRHERRRLSLRRKHPLGTGQERRLRAETFSSPPTMPTTRGMS